MKALLLVFVSVACFAQQVISVIPNPSRTLPGELRFVDLQPQSHYVGFKGPHSAPQNLVWELPATVGDVGTCLMNDGAMTLAWLPCMGGTGGIFKEALKVTRNTSETFPPLEQYIGTHETVGYFIGYTGEPARVNVTAFGSIPIYQFSSARGNPDSLQALGVNDSLGVLGSYGYYGSGWSSNRTSFQFVTTENWSAGAQGTAIEVRTTANGSTSARPIAWFGQDGGFYLGGNNYYSPDSPFHVNGRVTLGIRGPGSAGVLELSSGEGDWNRDLGLIEWVDKNSQGDKIAAAISGYVNGQSGGSRGGSLVFYTRRDGETGMTQVGRWTDNGNLIIGSYTRADDINYKLQVDGSAIFTGTVVSSGSTTLNEIIIPNDSDIRWKEASGNPIRMMFFDGSNDFHIGVQAAPAWGNGAMSIYARGIKIATFYKYGGGNGVLYPEEDYNFNLGTISNRFLSIYAANISLTSSGALRAGIFLQGGAGSSGGVGIRGPASSTNTYYMALPAATPTTGQALIAIDNNGNMGWGAGGTGGGGVSLDTDQTITGQKTFTQAVYGAAFAISNNPYGYGINGVGGATLASIDMPGGYGIGPNGDILGSSLAVTGGIRIGTTATANYVLTTDQWGQGSWQPNPGPANMVTTDSGQYIDAWKVFRAADVSFESWVWYHVGFIIWNGGTIQWKEPGGTWKPMLQLDSNNDFQMGMFATPASGNAATSIWARGTKIATFYKYGGGDQLIYPEYNNTDLGDGGHPFRTYTGNYIHLLRVVAAPSIYIQGIGGSGGVGIRGPAYSDSTVYLNLPAASPTTGQFLTAVDNNGNLGWGAAGGGLSHGDYVDVSNYQYINGIKQFSSEVHANVFYANSFVNASNGLYNWNILGGLSARYLLIDNGAYYFQAGGSLAVSAIRIGSSSVAGYVLTSDYGGNGSWQPAGGGGGGGISGWINWRDADNVWHTIAYTNGHVTSCTGCN